MRLWLLRHAKSSWHDPSVEDRDRPLVARGERAADRMRDYFAAAGIRPAFRALLLCASNAADAGPGAVRARTGASGSWHEVGKTPGELTRFVVPRELG